MSGIHVAVIMRNLMRRIGHAKFYVQGGDYGHHIGSNMATLFPDEILGFHTNMAVNLSKLATLTWLLGGLWPSLIEKKVPERMYPVSERLKFYLEESGYFHLQATKPDTIGKSFNDTILSIIDSVQLKDLDKLSPLANEYDGEENEKDKQECPSQSQLR